MYIVYEHRSGDDCVGGAKPGDDVVAVIFFYKSKYVGKVTRKRLSHVSKPFCVMMLLVFSFSVMWSTDKQSNSNYYKLFYEDTFE